MARVDDSATGAGYVGNVGTFVIDARHFSAYFSDGFARTMVQLGLTIKTVPYAPYQLHLLVLSSFASLVAPFGGFFASGFKRAFNIKDFGHSIPGHGGMTDRMDCQCVISQTFPQILNWI